MIKIAGILALSVGGLAFAAIAVWTIAWLWLTAIDQVVAAFGVSREVAEHVWHGREFRAWRRRKRGEFEVRE